MLPPGREGRIRDPTNISDVSLTSITVAQPIARGPDNSKANVTLWRILIAAACVAMLVGTPLPHLDSDAALFGQIAKNILDTGEWLTLSHPMYKDWVVDKPPLTFWIMAVSLWLGGQTDSALRLWHILLSILLVYVVYRIARLDGREEEALLAALLVATFQQVFYYSMAPQHDVPVTLFLALAFSAYLTYRREGRWWWTVLGGVWIALATLTKGILWPVAFSGIAVLDSLVAWWGGERPPWRLRHILAGAAVFVLLAAPWFVIGVVRQGPPFVHVFLFEENSIGRLAHSYMGPGLVTLHSYFQLLFAYIPLLMVGMLPWTGLLPGAVLEGWRSLRSGPPAVRLCAVWFGAFFAAVSISHGDRIIRYLLPCYPPLAVLAGRFLAGALDARRRLQTAAIISLLIGLPIMLAALWLAMGYSPHDMRFYLPLVLPMLALFSVTILAFAVLALLGRGRQAVAAAVVGSLLSYLAVYVMLMEHWERLWPWPEMSATVDRLYRPGDRVVVVGGYSAETNFLAYWTRAQVEPVDETAFAAAWRRQRVFALLAPDLVARLKPQPTPIVLLRTPMGWNLVTNR